MYDMSHSDNTQREYDTNFPVWLAHKLWVEHVDPEIKPVGISRQAGKRQWMRDMEMELSE